MFYSYHHCITTAGTESPLLSDKLLESVCAVVDDHTVRFHLPGPDGIATTKFRGFHIASSAFWREQGFGYKKLGSGEGQW